MDGLASKVGSGESLTPHTPPSELKTYGFVVAIILGIGGLAAGGAGVAGYFHVGALSNMAQIDAIIMMAAGGGGAILFIVGIVGTVKNCQPHNDVDSGHSSSTNRSTKITDAINSIDTRGGLVYGPEAWPVLGQIWGCELEILDTVPEAPQGDVAEGRIRLYIPQRVKVNGEPKELTLNSLIEMRGGPFENCGPIIKDQFGNDTASGWIEIDKSVIPESRLKRYDIQEKMVEEKGCRMPSVLEAVVLNLMVFAFTGVRLYGEEPLTYTRCSGKGIVGGFGSSGLNVDNDYFHRYQFASGGYGVAALSKF